MLKLVESTLKRVIQTTTLEWIPYLYLGGCAIEFDPLSFLLLPPVLFFSSGSGNMFV